ncbi:MAG: hypothetical protein JSW47_03715 [Phycisphaerales bacterium]|nr:MAG: hypothetical protein JSW47_03715 [Phycisphaerales bacterium]
MVTLKNISIILFSTVFFSQAQAVEPRAKSDFQIDRNENGGIPSNASAHISLVLVEENEGQRSYRWGITRRSLLKVIQGWYAFDEEGIIEHGGGGRDIAEARPMRLSLQITKKDGFLALNRGYGFSSTTGDQKADVANKIKWPVGSVLKTHYLSEPTELTDRLQPLWKGELTQDQKVLKTVVYAVRVVGDGASNELFDVRNTAEALRIGKEWAPIPDPAKLIFDGRTIGQWIAQWDSRIYDDKRKATEMLTKIGKPAVPFMVEIIKQGGNHAGYARTVLGNMGPDAEEALDWLIETALDRNTSDSQGNRRRNALICLSNMTWASERLLPVFTLIAEDTQAETSVRQSAITGLSHIGGRAMDVIQRIADSDSTEIRDYARRAISELVVKEGQMTRSEYYTWLVEKDPFDPSVPSYLTSSKGMVNSGRTHPLTNKVKTLYRQRLEENPDPELAWRLATIIQNSLRNTQLQWAAPTDSSRGRANREDPTESFTSMAEVLELGFTHAQTGTELHRDFGYALAKLRLLQGDWERMNAVLKEMGQKLIPGESRPWLPAPPVDWSVGLSSHWQICDESMRSGNCSLEFRIEKDGKGLKGVHVLVKRAPEPTRGFSSGIAADTLFLAPYPVGDRRFSFGYRGGDREQTRYAVTDESGTVRFERLPEIPVKIEVLVLTSNFAEAGTNWDLWMEVEPGKFKMAKIFGPDFINPREEPAVVTLKPGQTVHYPRLVVRPAFALNVQDWDRVKKDDFVLTWRGLDSTLQKQVAHYELEMTLSAPSQMPDSPDGARSSVHSAREILTDTQWPVGSRGVDGLRLEPGNIYVFEVRAIGDNNTVIARWPKTRVWVPWGYRRTNAPISGIGTGRRDNSPIHHGVWFRGTFRRAGGPKETLPERVERFLREQPNAFEHNYVRMGKAWLDWHAGDIEGARQQLEQLVKDLPTGNLARGTTVWLLQQMDDKKEPPKRLNFVPDRE